jgi:hypothetical protein
MARQTTSPSLVDAFVQKINSQPREPERLDEVPDFLRENTTDKSQSEVGDGWTSWHIVRRDNSTRIDELQKQTGKPFLRPSTTSWPTTRFRHLNSVP